MFVSVSLVSVVLSLKFLILDIEIFPLEKIFRVFWDCKFNFKLEKQTGFTFSFSFANKIDNECDIEEHEQGATAAYDQDDGERKIVGGEYGHLIDVVEAEIGLHD